MPLTNRFRAYRLHLYSENRTSGTWNDATFFVDLNVNDMSPDVQHQVALEAFTTSVDTASANTPFVMVMGAGLGDNAYSTVVNGQQSIVAHSRLPHPTATPTTSTIGSRVNSIGMFQSRLLNVRLQAVDGTLLNLASPTWAATLVLYPVTEDF